MFAIVLGLFIDMAFDWIRGKSPRDDAVANIELMRVDLEASLQSFFEGDLNSMSAKNAEIYEEICLAESLAYEADPALRMFPGFRMRCR